MALPPSLEMSLPYTAACSTALSVVGGLGPRNHLLCKKCFAFDGLPGQARRWADASDGARSPGQGDGEYPTKSIPLLWKGRGMGKAKRAHQRPRLGGHG